MICPIMRDINEIMPKIPNMLCGAVTNMSPTVDNINNMFKILKKDSRWHTVIEHGKEINIDGVSIRRSAPMT